MLVVFLRISECGRWKQNCHFLHCIFPSNFLYFQNQRNLGTDYLCKLCWYRAFWLIMQIQAFLWRCPALPYPCAPNCHPLLCWQSGLSGHSLLDTAIPCWHRGVWWCSAMGREGNDTSGSWGCLMPVVLPEGWCGRGLAAQVCRVHQFGTKSTSVSLSCCFNSRQQERPTSGQRCVKWKVPCLLICMVRLTFQRCTRFTLCVVREGNAKRNNNKIYGIKRRLCHCSTEYVL